MSESRNPLDIFSDDFYEDYERGVAFTKVGKVVTRRGLEGHDPKERDLVTLVLMTSDSKPGRLTWSGVDMLASYNREEQKTPEAWMEERHAPEILAEETCHPYEGEYEMEGCPKPPVLIINGFSGPGYVALCLEHKQAPIDALAPQVWLPVRVNLIELDELIYNGALRPDWA